MFSNDYIKEVVSEVVVLNNTEGLERATTFLQKIFQELANKEEAYSDARAEMLKQEISNIEAINNRLFDFIGSNGMGL